jgi:hypothetical protein
VSITSLSFPEELSRLARFGANISDAFGCFIFLPERIARLAPNVHTNAGAQSDLLRLVGFHSLCNDVLAEAKIAADSGLIGWVAKHGRSIHVSPFERDSRTLGVYSVDQQLKSFIGIPILLDNTPEHGNSFGVIACDSRKAFAFSKLQGKLLEELAEQVSSTVRFTLQQSDLNDRSNWDTFLHHGHEVAAALGVSALDALRVRVTNFYALEAKLTSPGVGAVLEQLVRLIRQALPPHSPLMQLPNGDVVLIVDNMMTTFYEAKIQAISQHVSPQSLPIQLEFVRAQRRKNRAENFSLEQLIGDTLPQSTAEQAPITRLEKVANGVR